MYQSRTPEEAERILDQVARSNPDVLGVFAPDWSEIRFLDDAYETIWGRPVSTLVANPTVFLEDIHPDDREQVEEAMATAAAQTPVELEFRVINAKTKEVRNVWSQTKPISDGENGQFVSLATYVRDITERKENERQLKATNERLEVFQELLSHELKNHLQTALGYLELEQDQMDSTSDNLLRVHRALERMNEMTTEVLALPRLDIDSLNQQRITLQELVQHSWESIEHEDATLQIDGDQTLLVDRSLFQHVFENLFRNAIEHNEEAVTISIGPLPERTGFYIQDDGVGIPEDATESAFELGYSTGGTGLGLALVQEIIDLHGGTIQVTDVDGARFEITGIPN